MIIKAHPSYAKKLTKLSIASKSHWDYSDEEMAVFETELQITEDYIYKNDVWVYKEDDVIIAYYSTQTKLTDTFETNVKIPKGYWLDHMFVDPKYIGTGIGAKLFTHFVDQCTLKEINKALILADPNAVDFYIKKGALHKKDFPSSIENRKIPYLELSIELNNSVKIVKWLSTNSLRKIGITFPIALLFAFLFISPSFDFTQPLVGNIFFAFSLIGFILSTVLSLFLSKGPAKLIKFPLAPIALLSFPILIFISLDILELIKSRGVDISLVQRQEVEISNKAYRLYETSGSRKSDFWVIVREETTVFPGIVHCTTVYEEKNDGGTTIQKGDDTTLNILFDGNLKKAITIGK